MFPRSLFQDTMRSDPIHDQIIQWLGLKFRVPSEWQIVRHSVAPDAGRLVLVDRRRERMELYWHSCAREPDLERTLEDQRSKERLAEPEAAIEPCSFTAGWRGFRRRSGGGDVVSRAGRYDSGSKRWLEVVIVAPAGAKDGPSTDLDVLGSVEVTGPAGSCTRWQAFDIDLVTPAGFRLVVAQVRPADVAFDFRAVDSQTGELGTEAARVHRRGMADAWYAGDPEQVLHRDNPGVRFLELRQDSAGPHPALIGEGRAPGTRLGRLLGRRATCRSVAWHCDQRNAVYCVTTTSRDKTPLMPRDFVVSCCRGSARA